MGCHFTKFQAICSGFKNYAFPSESFEKLATERAKICAECSQIEERMEFKVLDMVAALHPNFKGKQIPVEEFMRGAGCKACKCYLPAKVRQLLETCPEGKWE